jgi:hypothetical protein
MTAPTKPNADAGRGEAQALAHHQLERRTSLGAEGEGYAERKVHLGKQ